MTRRRLRVGAWIALLAAVVVVLLVTLGVDRRTVPSAGGSVPTPDTAPTYGGPAVGGVSDWTHVESVLAMLQMRPPTEPLVVLLGGSAARESTTTDQGPGSWAADVAADGGGDVYTYNLGTRMQSFEKDLKIVQYLPRGTLVFIGVNLGRFAQRPSDPHIRLPLALPLVPYSQHMYTYTDIHTDVGKVILTERWLGKSYTHFKERYAHNARLLTELVKDCKRRGLHPVLLDLPRDLDVIGHLVDKPLARMTATCEQVAAAQHVPWVSFVARAHIPSSGFYDEWHMVEPGRVVWQKYLSAATVQMLAAYPQTRS